MAAVATEDEATGLQVGVRWAAQETLGVVASSHPGVQMVAALPVVAKEAAVPAAATVVAKEVAVTAQRQ